MRGVSVNMLNLMFRPNETICVSNSKYGYHSIPLESAIEAKVKLVSPNAEYGIKEVDSNTINMVALNPIKGWREDANCTAFRNFLIELDTSTREQQIEYIKAIGMPVSAMIWSGSKSVHALISLSIDLPNEKAYRLLYKWILNIATASDQALGNPSRSIRLAGAIRPETGKEQDLIELNGPITLKELSTWLSKHPDAKPKISEKRVPSKTLDKNIKRWIARTLENGNIGYRQGRNRTWFSIAYEFALQNHSFDDTIDLLSTFFVPDRDFKDREWKNAIKSAFKIVNSRRSE